MKEITETENEVARLRRFIRRATVLIGLFASAGFIEPGLFTGSTDVTILRSASYFGVVFFGSATISEFFLHRENVTRALLLPGAVSVTLPYLLVAGIGTAESAWLPLTALIGGIIGGSRHGLLWLAAAISCAIITAAFGAEPHTSVPLQYYDTGHPRPYYGGVVILVTILTYGSLWMSERFYVQMARRHRRSKLQLQTTVRELEETLTERDELRDKLVESQKMESLGLMAGGLAHDFNNLLTGIIGELELASLDADGEVAESVEYAKDSALAASEMTAALLSYAGRTPMRRDRLDPVEVVESVRSIAHSATGRRVPIVFDAVEEVGWFSGDHAMIEQVLLNLILNAAQAMNGHPGQVVIEIERRYLGPDELARNRAHTKLAEGEFVMIKVIDSGTGIDSQTLSRIFEPFYTSKSDGRGLGLAASLGIVRSHEGGLFVESVEGEGSLFTVAFPAVGRPVETPAKSELPKIEGAHRILIADDRPEVLNAVARLVESLGLQAVARSSGAEVVALFEQSPDSYDVALLDVMMPDLRGDVVAEMLRAIRPDLPVVLMSGYIDEVTKLESWADDQPFLSKPVRREALREILLPQLAVVGSRLVG